MRTADRCCEYATCNEPPRDCCGGCCRALGACQLIEKGCPVCWGAGIMAATSLLGEPVTKTIPCPVCR